MKRSSLSLRLLFVGGLSVCVAVAATGVAISYLFAVYFEDRILAELEDQLLQLTANLTISPDGLVEISPMPDQRFEQPLSGLYWQISPRGESPILSRSLWDQPIDSPDVDLLGQQVSSRIFGPRGEQLMELSWRISVAVSDEPAREISLTVATDLSELEAAASQFQYSLAAWLSLLAATLILAAWLQVRIGLSPLEAIRTKIEKTKSSPDSRLEGKFPSEVVPLVNEVNSLLDHQQYSLEKVRQRTADLAHGLKTPLTVMAALTNDVRNADLADISDQIDRQIAAMRTFIERELARSRSGRSGLNRCDLKQVAVRVVEAISKLPTDSDITWEINIPSGIQAPFDDHDMSEVLGNLLDNARNHAASRVSLNAINSDDVVRMSVEDDGPGVPEDFLASVVQRGERLKADGRGEGLGLTIVRDLAESHECDLELRNIPGGGLSVSISWAGAEAQT